ncbi:hypothetical protein ABZV77_11375 [Streptomyces sp. NPDC004732]|uniref:hypothetical protein n=1 Tax=Streptomyces sp. NPDC004732 TaxID=3154290 RepID=UPI0033BC7E0C
MTDDRLIFIEFLNGEVEEFEGELLELGKEYVHVAEADGYHHFNRTAVRSVHVHPITSGV